MNENKIVGFDPQIFKEQKKVVEAIIGITDDKAEFEENIKNMLDYLEDKEDIEDEEMEEVDKDGE